MVTLFATVIIAGSVYAQFPFAPVVTPAVQNFSEPTPSDVTGYEQDRIVGGELTTITKFPYLVDIRIGLKHLCGASYIHPLWVLTAAHCLTTYRKKVLTCAMGMTFLNDFDCQLRNSTGIYPHKNYNARNDSNDIGLIRIAKPFHGSSRVTLIRLPEKPMQITEKCRVAGWGVTHQDYMRDRSKLSNQLRYVEVPLISQKRCSELYYLDKFQPHFKDTKIFCAGYEEGTHDACQGDSGGPLTCHNIQVGIVSWGIGCGNELPGVYSNVTTFLPWIKGVIEVYNRHDLRSDDLNYNIASFNQKSILLFIVTHVYFVTINTSYSE